MVQCVSNRCRDLFKGKKDFGVKAIPFFFLCLASSDRPRFLDFQETKVMKKAMTSLTGLSAQLSLSLIAKPHLCFDRFLNEDFYNYIISRNRH